jgi:hypothetical protein
VPIPMAERSKARLCRYTLAGIAGSNPTGGRGCLFLVCCVLSGTGLCNGPIPCPDESYQMWSVIECDTTQLYFFTPAVG